MKQLTWILLAIALAGCGQSGGGGDPARLALMAPPTGPLVASVNGEAISEPVLAAYARGRGLDLADATQRQQALDGLIEAILLAQDGLASGDAESAEARAEAALVRLQYLASRKVASAREAIDLSDAKVFEYYQQEAARAGGVEWRLQHILFEDEASATAAADRAIAGEDFEALMAEYAPTARQAKALEWSIPTRLPSELAEVAAQLPDGMVAPAPIRTSYGWHVLRRAESRPFAPPPFEQVKEGARQQLTERALKDYIVALRAKAQVATGASAPASGG